MAANLLWILRLMPTGSLLHTCNGLVAIQVVPQCRSNRQRLAPSETDVGGITKDDALARSTQPPDSSRQRQSFQQLEPVHLLTSLRGAYYTHYYRCSSLKMLQLPPLGATLNFLLRFVASWCKMISAFNNKRRGSNW